jgi:hypothetical protein
MSDQNFLDLNSGHINRLPTSWLKSLVEQEKSWEASGVIDAAHHDDLSAALNQSSIDFVDNLKNLFDSYVQLFNELRGSDGPNKQIKIFKIANTANDFILFRNSLKLIISRKNADVIGIGLFLGNTPTDQRYSHELKAHVGPFKKISWQIHGEDVDAQSLVQEYLTEFIKQSTQ